MKRLLIAILTTLLTLNAYPHAGEDHGPKIGDAGASTGPITLSAEAIKNLAVQSVEAKIEPLQKTISMVARIEPPPEKHAQITARFEGRVLELLVKIGESVKQGQPLLKLDPRQIGNPPVTLRSPLNGFVIKQNLVFGQTFSADTVLMEVADHRQVLARGTTYENAEIAQIKVGDMARVTVDIFPGETFVGKVQRVDAGIERDSRTFEVFALIDNNDLRLKPNLQASLFVGLGEAQEVVAIPLRAVLGEIGNYFVFVQEKETFEKRPVVLGLKAGDLVEIQDGVFSGEQVVVQGNYQLQFATSKVKDKKKETTGSETLKHTVIGWKWIVGAVVIGGVLVLVVRFFFQAGQGGPPKPGLGATLKK